MSVLASNSVSMPLRPSSPAKTPGARTPWPWPNGSRRPLRPLRPARPSRSSSPPTSGSRKRPTPSATSASPRSPTRPRRIWDQLKLQSNVSLEAVHLGGTGKARKVELNVTVDGQEGAALGVMSQGELHSLALSLFIPRATLPESPFRFIVIDDPVQSMDPARVDGLARVLQTAGKDRQVIVFTHDDRLPEAVRRLDIDATVIEVTRREGSVVEPRRSKDPVSRYIEDAMALAYTDDLPAEVARRVIPGLCREALEAACMEAIRRRRIGRGEPHAEVEALLPEGPEADEPRRAGALRRHGAGRRRDEPHQQGRRAAGGRRLQGLQRRRARELRRCAGAVRPRRREARAVAAEGPVTGVDDLLRGAEALLGRSGGRAGSAWPHAVTLLTRQAIERSLSDLWRRCSPGLESCSMHAQILCLSVVGLEPSLAGDVRDTWARLSAACHYHPYDIGPSGHELRGWIVCAQRLNEFVRSPGQARLQPKSPHL